MSRAITRLAVRSFRGATQPANIDIEGGKPLVVIFGENGCGKSSLVDAIDFVANRSFGSLIHRSVDGKRHPFLPSFGDAMEDVEIKLETGDGGMWTARLAKQKPSIERTSEAGELPIVRVLRRAEILDIVEATPSERYKALGPFIDASSYEKSEVALREALRGTEDSYDQAIARQEQASKSLEDLWEAEGSPQHNSVAWAKSKSQESVDELQDRQSTLRALQKAAATFEASVVAYGKAAAGRIRANQDLAAARKELEELPALEGGDAVQLVSMLRAAAPLVSEERKTEKCPLCLEPKPGAELRVSIRERLEDLGDYVQLADRLEKATRESDSRRDARTAASEKLSEEVGTYAIAAEAAKNELPPKGSELLASLAEFLGDDTSEGIKQRARVARRLAVACAPLGRKLSDITADLARHNAIRVQYENLLAAREEAKHQQQLANRLKEAHQIVENTRKAYVNAVLDSIGDKCMAYYDRIHPDEPLGSPRLSMHENRPGSVELAGIFGTQHDVPPQGYYSESHLDTLGFCVWLAIAQRGRPEDTVLLIDDVFTSVDAQHISRIVSLISDIAEEFAQVIVATHYRNWRDRYRLAHAPGLKAQLLELHRWSLARGISLSSTRLAVEELDEKCEADPLDRQAAASQAGILLEALLDHLTLLYRRRLPRNHENEWTLGDLLSACRKLFRDLEIEREEQDGSARGPTEGAGGEEQEPDTVTEAVAPFYDDTGRLIFLRNQVGCHFNLSGGEVSDDDVRAFGKATSALVQVVACQDCGQIPSRRKGDHFACVCGKTRMRPLEFGK